MFGKPSRPRAVASRKWSALPKPVEVPQHPLHHQHTGRHRMLQPPPGLRSTRLAPVVANQQAWMTIYRYTSGAWQAPGCAKAAFSGDSLSHIAPDRHCRPREVGQLAQGRKALASAACRPHHHHRGEQQLSRPLHVKTACPDPSAWIPATPWDDDLPDRQQVDDSRSARQHLTEQPIQALHLSSSVAEAEAMHLTAASIRHVGMRY